MKDDPRTGAPNLHYSHGFTIPDRLLAVVLGVSNHAIVKLRSRGTIRMLEADRYACRLGAHPSEIWGDLWWQGTDLEEDPA